MDERVANALTFVVLGVMGVRLVSGARHARSARGRVLIARIGRSLHWRHVWPVPFVLAAVISVAALLLQIPGLDWGWWSAIGGEGNPVFGSSSTTSGSVLEWVLPLVFVALLIPALPLFAHAEERVFRQGAERWSNRRRAFKIVQFGLAHALIGIPIGAALALSVGGAYFMAVYLEAWRSGQGRSGATLEAARAHTAYNAVIVLVVVFAVVIDALV